MKKHSVTIVVFGGTGDLVQKKLMSALFDLYNNEIFSDDFRIVAFSRKQMSHEEYRQFARNILDQKGVCGGKDCDGFLEKIFYCSGDLNNQESYLTLSNFINELDKTDNLCSNKLFYLAIPPNLYESVFNNLASSGMTIPCATPEENKKTWARVLVEKPFGNDMDEAQKLDTLLGKLFSEDQIFRIDHYLAKETIQNILTFRFANSIFNYLWNKDHIQEIRIKVYEDYDIRGRGRFYDGIGALRDMGQNHMLQMLSLITMQDPKMLGASFVRNARTDALEKIYLDKKDIVNIKRGQYEGYLSEEVDANSETETFFRISLKTKDKQLKGIPLYLEHGKALNQTKTEIEIIFKERPSCACPVDDKRQHTNKLIFVVKPEDGIRVRFWIKQPGFDYQIDDKELSFSYKTENQMLPNPYERVLFDCIRGDQTLFTSTAEVKAEWKIITSILDFWQKVPLKKYKKGSKPEEIVYSG
ncbi:glucose-6-phosphate dehydrogenase [Candidatus Nomurabacteria bacterium]|nr:glucose-6-phosphate dehydrogenase [Candidatus Nomurabacteria bacterium]